MMRIRLEVNAAFLFGLYTTSSEVQNHQRPLLSYYIVGPNISCLFEGRVILEATMSSNENPKGWALGRELVEP